MTSASGYIIAVDGGGTSCRVAVADMDGTILGRSLQGAANVVSNVEGAVANIAAGARAALAEAGLAHLDLASLPAFMGLAGVAVAGDLDAIGAQLPFARSVFEDDAAIAMQGALGDDDGIVAILGTGSVYVGRQGETMRRAGGWGFVVGDLGSGARLGRALLQDTLLAHDKIFTHSPLTRAVMAEFGDDPVKLVDLAQQETPGGFARFAPMVFEYAEQGDPIGSALVKGAVAHVDAALAAVTWPQCRVLCLMGGLAPFYRERIEPRFRAILREPKADALTGAVQLAVRQFGGGGEHVNALDLFTAEHVQAQGTGPLYVKLRRVLEDAIESGVIGHGEALPTERDIAERAALSRVTVRKAVDDLVSDGRLIRRQGSGTFVAAPVSKVRQPLSQLTSFSEDMARRGLSTRSQWLARGLFDPSPEEMMRLGLPVGSPVARLERLRIANEMPLAIERAAIAPEFLPDPDTVTGSLYAALEARNARPVHATQRISARNVDREDALLLGVQPGDAALQIERVSRLASGRVIEFTRSVYRGDAYDFVAELTLTKGPA